MRRSGCCTSTIIRNGCLVNTWRSDREEGAEYETRELDGMEVARWESRGQRRVVISIRNMSTGYKLCQRQNDKKPLKGANNTAGCQLAQWQTARLTASAAKAKEDNTTNNINNNKSNNNNCRQRQRKQQRDTSWRGCLCYCQVICGTRRGELFLGLFRPRECGGGGCCLDGH